MLLLVSCLGCNRGWNDRVIAESKATGDGIIDKLSKYQRDHGSYPASLEALVPKYMESVPLPVAGERRWIYVMFDDGRAFELRFESKSQGKTCCYDTTALGWYVASTTLSFFR
jgi:hypothetical protein